jgi:hypothetical protein
LCFQRRFPVLSGYASQLPEVVCQDAPFKTDFTIVEAFASQGFSKVGVFEDTDPGFGTGTSFL